MTAKDRRTLKNRQPKGFCNKGSRLSEGQYHPSAFSKQLAGLTDIQEVWNILFRMAEEEDLRKKNNAARANGKKTAA